VPNTVFLESAAGVGEGARTGLASVVTGAWFTATLFLTPIAAWFPRRQPRRRWSSSVAW
jgi:adenine/guanine/hypoxanthine permease